MDDARRVTDAAGPDAVDRLREPPQEVCAGCSLCPRCGADATVGFGAQLSCGHCGAVWQA